VEQTYTIGTNNEVNPSKGIISPSSPLAQAVLGKCEGDEVIVKAPIGSYNIKIIKIMKVGKAPET